MQFGVREISDVVFKAKAPMKIGTSTFKEGQPVLYIDTAKTSSLEGGATAVYATGGRGNTRLLSWEGARSVRGGLGYRHINQGQRMGKVKRI